MTLIPGESRIGNYLLEKEVGKGAFASVWLARHAQTNLTVAIKTISKASIDCHEAKTRLNREIALLKQMRHPFIAEFFEALEDDNWHYLVMEFAENGNLLEFITNKGRLTEAQARHYFSELVSVLEYLHNDKLVAHRDLKAENVLLDRHNNIRVIDFGLSNQFTSFNPQLSTACGSPTAAAPEMVKGQLYTRAADIWSSGIMLYALVAGELPFNDDNMQRLLHKIVYTEVAYPSFMSSGLVDLLQKLLAKNPDARITLDKIKEHHWFSQTEYAGLVNAHLGESGGSEPVIDKEVVDQMTGMGIDCKLLHQQILMGEFTELTAMYRELLKNKTTDAMKDILANLQNLVQRPPTAQGNVRFTMSMPDQTANPAKCAFPKMSTGPLQVKPSLSMKSTLPTGPNALPFPSAGKGPTILQAPPTVHIAARRLSRPVAVRKMDIPATMPNAARESP
jgi:serine/threonine protein kinase